MYPQTSIDYAASICAFLAVVFLGAWPLFRSRHAAVLAGARPADHITDAIADAASLLVGLWILMGRRATSSVSL